MTGYGPARKRAGSVIIEFAFVSVLLAILAVTVMDASAAWRMRNVLITAAREGARIASALPNLQPDDATVLQSVDAILAGGGIDPGTTTRSVRFTSPLQPGDPVTVEVSRVFQPVVVGLVPAFADLIRLQSASTMRYGGG